jgi:hypothetical protein
MSHKKGGWFIRPLFREFDVSTEDELYEKLIRESKELECIHCHRTFPIEKMRFPQGEPVCPNCR